MYERAEFTMNTRQGDRQVVSVAESIGNSHPDVPKAVLEEMAQEALAQTEDARIQGHRVPLAQHEVMNRAISWERSHHGR